MDIEKNGVNILSSITFTRETLVYLVILLLAVIIRFSNLGSAPLQTRELPTAIATIHTATAIPPATIAANPILRVIHQGTFMVFPKEANTLRIPYALAGVLLICSPWLFRPLLGSLKCLVLSVFFLLSPTLLFISRSAENTILALLGIVFVLYTFQQIHRFHKQPMRRRRWQIIAALAIALTVLLTDGRGYLLVISVTFALVYAVGGWRKIETLNEHINHWPLRHSLEIAALATLLLSTTFLTQMSGINLVGNLLSEALQGWSASGSVFTVLSISVFYELALWLFAVYAYYARWRKGNLRFLDRFAAAWLLLLMILLSLDRGSQPSHSSWLTPPLALISLSLLHDWLRPTLTTISQKKNTRASWVIGSFTALIFIGMSIQLQILTSALQLGSEQSLGGLAFSASSLTVMRLLLGLGMLITLYIGASYLNYGTLTLRLMSLIWALLLIFGNFAAGLRTAYANYDQVDEPWQNLVHPDANHLFVKTLDDVVQQSRDHFPEYAVAIFLQRPENQTQVSTLLWLLRRFEQVEIVKTANATLEFPMVITDAPLDPDEKQSLIGQYSGQRFALSLRRNAPMNGNELLRHFWRRPPRPSSLSHESPSLDVILWFSPSVANDSSR